MLFKNALLLLAPNVITAFQVGVLVPQEFNKRSIPASGGWSLQASSCPTDTSVCGAAWCCPNSLTCVRSGLSDNAEACCPTESVCQPSLQAAPICADSSWNLWNTTNVDGTAFDGYTGYLCCLPGQVGVQGNVDTVGMSAICVSPDTPVAQSLSGTLISPAATQQPTSSHAVTTATTTGSVTPTSAPTSSTAKSSATNIIPKGLLFGSGTMLGLITVELLF